jgi:hypothetical protein
MCVGVKSIVRFGFNVHVNENLTLWSTLAHINNMYNTCFWSLVLLGGRTNQEANKDLSVRPFSISPRLLQIPDKGMVSFTIGNDI